MNAKRIEESCNICGQQLNSWDARLSKTVEDFGIQNSRVRRMHSQRI